MYQTAHVIDFPKSNIEELNIDEIEQVDGAVLPIIAAAVLGFGGGVATGAALIYIANHYM